MRAQVLCKGGSGRCWGQTGTWISSVNVGRKGGDKRGTSIRIVASTELTALASQLLGFERIPFGRVARLVSFSVLLSYFGDVFHDIFRDRWYHT